MILRLFVVIIAALCPTVAGAADPVENSPPRDEWGEPAAATQSTGSDDTRKSKSLPTITIVGSDRDLVHIAGSAQVIDEQRLEETEYNDINRILMEVPGVYVREEDAFGLRPNIGIRGANSDRSAKVTLMEDGVLFGPAPYSAPAAYYFPLTTRMVAIEVFKGPASIQYGPQTIGGAINLVTRPIPEQREAMIDVSGGQRETWKTHGWAGGRWHNSGLLLEGVHLETDGFKDLDGGGDTGFTRNEAMVKADHRWSIAGVPIISSIKGGYSNEDSNETYLGISDEDFDITPLRRYAASQGDHMDWDRWEVELSQFATITPDLTLQLTTYRHDLDRTWRKLNSFEKGSPSLHDIFAFPTGQNAVYISVLRGDSDSTTPLETLLVGTNHRTFVAEGAQLTGTWFAKTGPLAHAVDAGLRAHYDEIKRDHTEDPSHMTNRTMVRTTAPTRQVADNTGEALAVATYLRDEIEWSSLTVSPGIRFESIETDYHDRLPTNVGQPETKDSDTQNVVIPGIGAVVSLPHDFSLLAGVHRGFSPVAPGQSSSAKNEESINYEAGGRYLGALGNAELIGFYSDYDNILTTCRQDSGCDPKDIDKQYNGGGASILGLELLAETEVEVKWGVRLPASLSYTFTHTEFRDTFGSASAVLGDVKAGDAMPYVPENLLSVSLGLERGPLGISTILTYVGEMRDVAGSGSIPENELIEDHLVDDLFAHWDFTERGRLYLGIDNLTDSDYIVSRRPFGVRPGKPFQVQAGIKYRFGG